MTVTRRKFLKNTVGIVAASGVSISLPGNVNNAWSKSSMDLGKVSVDVLSDGNLRLPVNMILPDIDAAELAKFFDNHDMQPNFVEPSCNLTLVRDGERTILFDVGSGTNFMASAGKLSEALEAIELDPSDVTHVVFTHGHPDHLWGLLDDFDDPVFSDAQYMISKAEWDYWLDDDTVNTIGEARQSFAAGAKRNLLAIEDVVSRFDFEEEILPGVRAMDTSGHTPGHTSFEVRSGSESVMIVGDALTNQHISFERPKWRSGSDQDPEKGIVTRLRMLDHMTADKMKIIGYHMPYPGIGSVEKFADAYKFISA